MLLAFWLGVIEVGQIWIATRTAEIADPILALLIAYAMSRFEGEGAAGKSASGSLSDHIQPYRWGK